MARDAGADPPREAGILGLLQHGSGRVALYGDSNCLDSSHQRTSCFEFLKPLLAWTAGVSGPGFKCGRSWYTRLPYPLPSEDLHVPCEAEAADH